MDFTRAETLVLNRVQKGIPCSREPYRAMGDELGISEGEVIDTVISLREKNVIRNISGIFNGKELGYFLSLVAFQVPEDKIEQAGAVISSHPGVSHNYLRSHKYNFWFTLAEVSEADFNKTVSVLAAKSGADDFLVLRNEKLLKIGVFLNVGDSDDEYRVDGAKESGVFAELDDTAKDAVRLLQIDLPSDPKPFDKIAEEGRYIHGAPQLLTYFSQFIAGGVMRRYAAVLRHRSAGFTANAMTAWKTGEDFNDEAFSECGAISHLYYRTIYPGRWEHPLFAMIHAKSKDELDGIIKDLSQKSGITDYLSLESIREFKKKRVTYFSDEFNEWKRLNYD